MTSRTFKETLVRKLPTGFRGRIPILAFVAILLTSINLRLTIASVPPILETIRADLGLSYTLISLLTSIPVLCMGLFAFGTFRVVNRFGREKTLIYSVLTIGIATGARVWGSDWLVLFISTVAAGIGIAISQTTLPAFVGTYFPDRSGFVTGAYSVGLAVGSALATSLTATIYEYTGSWPLALGIWALPSIAALVPLLLLQRYKPGSESRMIADTTQENPARTAGLPWRDPIAWIITLFFATTSAVFFTGITWLAPRYVALGWTQTDAGLLLSVFIITQIVGMSIVSFIGDYFRDHRPWIVGLTLVTTGSIVCIVLVPLVAPWVWAGMFGAGAGALFSFALLLPVDFAQPGTATDRLSSMAMGIGYLVAAVGPSGIGSVIDIYNSYSFAFAILSIVCVLPLVVTGYLSPGQQNTVT